MAGRQKYAKEREELNLHAPNAGGAERGVGSVRRPRCPQLLPPWPGREPGGQPGPLRRPRWLDSSGGDAARTVLPRGQASRASVCFCPGNPGGCRGREAAASPRHQVHGRVEPEVCDLLATEVCCQVAKALEPVGERFFCHSGNVFWGKKEGMLREGRLGATGCCLSQAAGSPLPAGGVCSPSKPRLLWGIPICFSPAQWSPGHWAACIHTPSKASLWGRNVSQGDRKSLVLVFTHPQAPLDLTSQGNPLAGQGNPLRKWKRSIFAWKITKERGKLARAIRFQEVCCQQVQLTRNGW